MSKRKNTRGPLTPRSSVSHKDILSPAKKMIVPMTPHEQRMARLALSTIDPNPQFKQQMKLDIGFQLTEKRLRRQLPIWLSAQEGGGSGFLMSCVLREFFREFNSRFLKHGPDFLPMSFNVLEAFFDFEPQYACLKIRREREFLLDASDYFKWYSHEHLLRTSSVLMDALEEGVIYSYDMLGHPEGYRVAGTRSTFVIAGISLIRHGSELSCLLVAGENPPNPSDDELQQIEFRRA